MMPFVYLPSNTLAFHVGKKNWVSRYLALNAIIPATPNRMAHVVNTKGIKTELENRRNRDLKNPDK